LIDNSELGKFKLEYKIKKAIFRGCKDYYIEDEKGNELNKIKGIGKNAEQLDYNTYLMKRPLTINDCKKLDNFDNFGSIYVTKHLKRIYKKGNIEGTQVIPHELTEEISTYLQTKFKRKKKYLKGKSSNDYNKNVG
jgi:hypothetical protein